ncbi:MAG: adenylyl-sulfate kinase [Mariniblastus sp.]|nr:adenylyl-sulfate kinase [Mariniblastus sp.]
MTEKPTEKTLVTWHEQSVARPRGCVVWFTGLSGSGKSTVANGVDAKLHGLGQNSFVLDGDNIRHGLNASSEILAPIHGAEFAKRFGLGFAAQDREENIRRIGCVAEIFCSSGVIALTAFVSPYRLDRQRVREVVVAGGSPIDFVEVFVDTPLEICERRDPKGLYQKARAGEIKGFTGIDAPYEAPEKPELHLDGAQPVEKLADQVIAFLTNLGKISQA